MTQKSVRPSFAITRSGMIRYSSSGSRVPVMTVENSAIVRRYWTFASRVARVSSGARRRDEEGGTAHAQNKPAGADPRQENAAGRGEAPEKKGHRGRQRKKAAPGEREPPPPPGTIPGDPPAPVV